MRHTYGSSLSPTGDEIAFIVRDDGFPYAVQASLEGIRMGVERPVRLPVEGPVTRVLHSPDGQWLACEVAPLGTERAQIWLVTTNPDDDSATLVRDPGDAKGSLVEWDGNQLAVAVVTADGVTEGRLVDPFTGKFRMLDRRADGQLVDAKGGYGLMRVGPRGLRELLLIHPDGTWQPLLPPDPGATVDAGLILVGTDHSGSDATEFPSPGVVEELPGSVNGGGEGEGEPAGLGRAATPVDVDNISLIVCGDWGSQRRRLLHISFVDGFPRATVMMEHSGSDVEHFVISRDCSRAAVLWSTDGVSQLELITLGEGLRIISRRTVELPGMVASGLSMTDDGSLLAVTVEGPNLKPSVDILRTQTGVFEALDTASRAQFSNDSPLSHALAKMGSEAPSTTQQVAQVHGVEPGVQNFSDAPNYTPELLRYTARDGEELSGWLYCGLSENRTKLTGAKGPVLIQLHGGPEGQSRPTYHDVISEVMDAGISVFTPNVRGSGGFGRRFVHADDRYGRFAGINDIADTVEFLINAGVADPEKVAISGRSYGGYLTLASLTRFPDLFAAGICACGMSDLETFYRDSEPWIASAAYPKYGYPIQDAELLKELSPLAAAKAVSAPVLFVHGAHDTNVPPTEAFQMKEALESHGIETDLLLFEDEGHVFEKRENRAVLAKRMVNFLVDNGLGRS